MERSLAGPHEVPRVGLFEPRIASFGKSQPLLRTLAPACIHRDGGHELEIVGVEPENPQESGEAREVAVEDLLQVRHPSATPILEGLRREQVHADQDVDGGYDLTPGEQPFHGARDSWVKWIVTKRVDTHCWL